MQAPDVAIVGGGVIGCAAAWYLARAGLRVEVYDTGPLGGEASGVSAGILAPLAESSVPGPFAALALAGLRAFSEDLAMAEDDAGLVAEYRRSGVLRLASNEAEAKSLREAAGWQNNAGLEMHWLEARQVASLEPGLSACAGALYSPDEGHIPPQRLVATLATAAANRGVTLHPHSAPPRPLIEQGRVQGLIVGGMRYPAGQVLLTAGAWSRTWAESVGVRVPVHPVKGQMLLLRALPPPVRRVIFHGHGYLVPRADGTVYVGATVEDAGFDRRVTAEGLRAMSDLAVSLAPTLADAEFVSAAAGLRPGSEDGLPVIGPAPGAAGLLVAAGHLRNGILMSLITGRLLTAVATGRPPELPIEPYSPARFAAADTRAG